MPAISQRLIFILAGIALAIAALFWITGALTGGKRAKVEAELNGNRADAAASSGADAVNTVGDRHAAETDIDRKVQDAQGNIISATDAAGADRAGRDGLCSVAAHFCPDRKLHHTHP
ncbi:hypothetical protein [Novosphingobium sp.]|uniref:hypothetical protein n=1 Tax=Novosphingobium sp. TaxID=1874826 RepID=UPI00286E8E1B|nr:hypothetical protein [Novosphingobium sp.]